MKGRMAVWWSNVEDALLKGGINLWPAGSKTHQLRDFLTFCIPHDPRGRSGRSKKGRKVFRLPHNVPGLLVVIPHDDVVFYIFLFTSVDNNYDAMNSTYIFYNLVFNGGKLLK